MMSRQVQQDLLSLFKKENKVDTTYPVVITVNGNTYNFTQDSLTDFIKESNARKDVVESAQRDARDAYRKAIDIRTTVYDFFNDRHESGDTELTADVSDINEMLEEIGADKLRNLYSAVVTITVKVDDIEAADEDEVQELIGDDLNVDIASFNVNIQDFNVDEITEY